MAKNRVDYVGQANQRLLEKARDEQAKKNARQGTKESAPGSNEKSMQESEKGKIKNQAEIKRAKELSEKVERERKEVQRCLDGALNLVASGLKNRNLSPENRNRYDWVLRNVEEARRKAKQFNRDTYTVQVMDEKNNIHSREDGIPIDELETVVSDFKQRVKKDTEELEYTYVKKEESGKIKVRYDIAKSGLSDEEWQQKMAWYGVLKNLPDNDPVKKEALALCAEWENVDKQKAQKVGEIFTGYSGQQRDQQLGEALHQVAEKYLKQDAAKLKENLDKGKNNLTKLQIILDAFGKNAKPYFAFHYKNNYRDPFHPKPLTLEQQKEQDLYNKHEAGVIAKDKQYRKMLLDKFTAKKELPAGFESMDEKQQNNELARLALIHRRVLDLPKEIPVPAEILEEEKKPASAPTSVVKPQPAPGTVPPAEAPYKLTNLNEPYNPEEFILNNLPHKLENTNPSYDWENKAIKSPGEIVIKVPEKADKKIFLIDISEIAKRMAWTKAEERLQKEFKDAGFFKRVWKGLSENAKRIQYFQEALNEVQKDNNLMRAISERVSGQAMPGSGPQISGEYLELLDKVVAEYKHDVVDTQREVGDSINNNPEIQEKFAELLHRYRTNKWDGAAYQGLDKRAAVELFVKENIAGFINKQSSAKWTTDVDRLKEAKGLLYANNFYEILESVDKNYKVQIDAAVKEVMDKNPEANIEAVRDAISKQVEGVQGLNLQLGLKERDIINNRPKGILNLYEKMVNWGENHKVLGKILLNPFVVGAAATVTSQGVQRAIKWAAVGGAVAAGATGFWVPLGVGAAAGGLYRAFKRGKDVKYDTAQELRHETLGGKGSGILGESGELGYGKAIMSFTEALSQVTALKDKKDFSDVEKNQLAEIYARLQLERGFLQDQENKFTKVDLFKMEEEKGKRFGTTEVDKSTLRVELKKLGISEQALQGLIDTKKGEILNIIKEVDKSQDSFRRKEMIKSGVMGAVMGFAGGVLAQEAMHLGGEQMEKLWGGSYFHNQHTSFDKITDWAKGSSVYQSHFGHGAAAGAAAEHTFISGRGQTSTEWMQSVKGHITGGNVEQIHTQNFYENPTGETTHVHNNNELRFFINKDSTGGFHYKVPVEQGGSWMVNGHEFQEADLDKAFADGYIKMLFVPDGGSPHDAITLDVDPTTKEIIIPHNSNIANLFDEATGRPKGSGFFGLAEQVGSRGDGSKNYIWINSDRGNGQNIDFGKITQEFIPDKAPAAAIDYDQAIATVPLTRKVYSRLGEDHKKEDERKNQEEQSKKSADKNKKTIDVYASGGLESGGGGGTEKAKNPDAAEIPVKAPEFTGDVLKRYLNPKYASDLLAFYKNRKVGELPKIDEKVVGYVIGGSKPGLDAPMKKDAAKAVWQLEQALVSSKVLNQEKVDEYYAELSILAEEAVKKEVARKAEAAKKAEEKAPAKGQPRGKNNADAGGSENGEDDNAENEPEEGDNLMAERKTLSDKWGKKFYLKMPSSPDKNKLAAVALKRLGVALGQYAQEGSVKKMLDKTFPGRKRSGLYIKFDKAGGKPLMENGVLILPADAKAIDILKVLEKEGLKRNIKKGKPLKPTAP